LAQPDGLIGGDILSHYDVELNFVARKLNLFSPDHCEGKVIYWPATAGAIVPFSMRRPSAGDTDIHVPITVDGKDLQAIIDTGAPVTAMGAAVAEKVFGITAASPGVERSSGDQEFGYVFHGLSFGGINVGNPRVTIIPDLMGATNHNAMVVGGGITAREAESRLIIGMDVLTKLHLYIAYGEKKLYITPPDQPVAAEAEH